MKIATLALAAAIAFSATAADAQQRYFARHQLIVNGSSSAASPSGGAGTGGGNGASGAWNAASWGEWDSTCSSAALRTRTVTCVANGSLVGDDQCDAATRPESTDSGSSTSGCGDTLTNAGFEQDKNSGAWGWSDSGIWQGYSPNAVEGSHIAQLQGAGFQMLQAPRNLKAGTRYRATINAWPTHPDARVHRIEIRAVRSGVTIGSSVSARAGTDQGWKEVSVDFTYQAGAHIDIRSLQEPWWLDLLTITPIN